MTCANWPGTAPIYGRGAGRHAVRGWSVVRPQLVLRQPAGSLEVAKPARRPAISEHLLVVAPGGVVRLAVAPHGVNHAPQPVGHG